MSLVKKRWCVVYELTKVWLWHSVWLVRFCDRDMLKGLKFWFEMKCHHVTMSSRQLLKTSGNFWHFGNIWQLLTTSDNSWHFLPTFINLCQLLPTFARFCQLLPIFTFFLFQIFCQIWPTFLPTFAAFVNFWQLLKTSDNCCQLFFFAKFCQFFLTFANSCEFSPHIFC